MAATGNGLSVLLPAAGMGLRLGQGPKALLRLNGRSLLEYSLATLRQSADQLIVAAPAGHLSMFRWLEPDVEVIEGGTSRQETVHRLLEHATCDLVLVHDAARPFLPADVVARVVTAARKHRAATSTVPVVDTLIRQDDGSTLPREELLAVQTPQAFERRLLLAAHQQAAAAADQASDDAGLVRRLGVEVATVEGSIWNFKLTHPADLQLARLIAPAWPELLGREPGSAAAC